ncbi:MAG: aspartyl/asparaginyl beta-hydroxylase domain-containing protein [Aquihabitans sp.]
MSEVAAPVTPPSEATVPPRELLDRPLGGRQSPAYVERDPVSLAVTSLLRLNARVIARHVPAGPVFDPAAFRGLEALGEHWPVIRAEWDALRQRAQRLPTVDQLIQREPGWDGDWESYAVRAAGGWFAHAERAVPETVRLLRGVEGLVQAAFSVLSPGAYLHPHRGPNTGVVRGLLGVDVPEPDACGLVVGSERLHLAEGACLAFDDTFEHAAWNAGSTERVALLLEIAWPVDGVARRVNAIAQRAFRHHPMVARGNRRFGALVDDAVPLDG